VFCLPEQLESKTQETRFFGQSCKPLQPTSSPKKLFSSSWLDFYHWFHIFLSTYLAYRPLTCYSSKASILSFLSIMVLVYHLSFATNNLIFSQSLHFLSNLQLLPLWCIFVSVTETALSSICEQQFQDLVAPADFSRITDNTSTHGNTILRFPNSFVIIISIYVKH